ncbi:MAG: NAD(P)H-dependent oxidoreductase, partial [Proteobacteria bacterium]|nr:NAD(P)H-dependent oxidoreductase [Pseudomonadota bacterium]
MTDKKIIGLCGSLRKASLNRKLLLEAVRLYGKCDFKEANLNLPLYNGDEEDIEKPKSTLNLYNDIKAADGVIITSPEYNKGISGVLKNSLDWVSRIPGSVWKEKPVVIMSAAAGRTGGETAQYMV